MWAVQRELGCLSLSDIRADLPDKPLSRLTTMAESRSIRGAMSLGHSPRVPTPMNTSFKGEHT